MKYLQCFVFDTCLILQQSIIITNVQNICFDIYRSPSLFDVSNLQWINDRPNALKHTLHDVSKIMFTTTFNEKQCTWHKSLALRDNIYKFRWNEWGWNEYWRLCVLQDRSEWNSRHGVTLPWCRLRSVQVCKSYLRYL